MAKGTITGDEVFSGVTEKINEAHEAFKKFLADYNEFSKSLNNISNTKQANAALAKKIELEKQQIKLLTDMARLEKEKANLTKANTQAQSAEITLEQKKERIKRSNVKLSEQEKYDQQQKNRLLKEDLALQSKYSTELKKAQIIRNGLARTIQDLNVKQSLGNKLTKKESDLLKTSQVQFKKYDSAIRGAEESVGRFNASVGNYKKALGGLAGVAKGFIATFGVYSGVQIIRDVFEQIKQIEQLDLALKKVTKSQEEFNQAQLFIQEISKFTGVGLISLTDSYKRFRGSIEGSNISLEQAQRIFERFSKASAILGSSTEETNGVLRALGQIISKGKVQAEELRGQLGDRLSGAFGLMAKAIGVSTAELDKMIEMGQITSDTLVKLAEQVGETFGVDTVDQIDTINASIGRLNTAWTILLKSFEDGSGPTSEVIKGVLKSLTNIIDKITEFNKGGDVKFDEGILQGAKVAIESVKDESDRLGISIREAATNIIPRYNKILLEWRQRLGDINEIQTDPNFFNRLVAYFKGSETEAKNALHQIGLYTKAVEVLKDISANGLQNDKLNTDIAKPIDTLKTLRLRLVELKKSLEETKINTPAFSKIQTEISAIEQKIKSLTGTSAKEVKTFIEGTISYYEDLISKEKDFQKNEAKTSEAFQESARKIRDYQKAIDDLSKSLEKISAIDMVGTTQEQREVIQKEMKEMLDNVTDTLGIKLGIEDPDIDAMNNALSMMAEAQEKTLGKMTKNAKFSGEEQAQIFGELFATFGRYYNLDLTAFEELIGGKSLLDINYAGTAKSIVGAIYDGKFKKYEEEEKKNRETLDAILNDKNASDKKKEQAQKEFDRKESEIKRKKAKADRDAVLIQIGIDGAQAAVKTYAQLGFPAGIAGAAAVLAIAGLQAAFVASQPLPKYFRGKGLGDNYEGPATWGEHQREVKIGADGNIQVSPNKTTPLFVRKDDIIIPSLSKFDQKISDPTSDVYRRLSKRVGDQSRSTVRFAPAPITDYALIGKAVERAMEKYSKRPTVWNGTVNVEQKRTRYHK